MTKLLQDPDRTAWQPSIAMLSCLGLAIITCTMQPISGCQTLLRPAPSCTTGAETHNYCETGWGI